MKNFTPDEVRAMSLAEATIAIDGYSEMKRAEAGVVDNQAPSEEDIADLLRQHEQFLRNHPD